MKKYILTLLILLTAWCQAYSQSFAIEVKLRPEMASRSGLVVETTEINALSLRHGVKLIPHPLAERHPEFSLYYTLVGYSCKESAINDFLATGKFENYVRDLSILIYPLSCVNPVTVNDPDFQNTHGWPLRLINAPCAWTITRGNPNVLIGVVDTEFRATHEDLQNRFASISGQSSGGHHHGTSVASVAAAGTNNERGIAGVGFNSRLAAYRIFHYANGSSYTHHARAAIMNLYLMGVPIINVSWTGSGLSRPEAQAITRSGTTLVLSGGNTVEAENHSYIADIPGVIIVSSVTQGNMIGPTNHSRSQYISIVAPGANIRVAGGDSDTHYRQVSGTSLSAPFVAGTIALMLSVNPALMPAQIEEILKTTADPIADGHLLPGRGRLNAFAAVQTARSIAPRIEGPNTISNTLTQAHNTMFVLENPPAGATVTWTTSGNLTIVGSSTSNTAVVRSRTPLPQSCGAAGWVRATVSLSGASVPPTVLNRNVTVGRVPDASRISSTYNDRQMPVLQTFQERLFYNGSSPLGMQTIEWAPAFGVDLGNESLVLPGFLGVTRNLRVNYFRIVEGIPFWAAQVQVRMQNQCGWSDWATLTYLGQPVTPPPPPVCRICLDPNCQGCFIVIGPCPCGFTPPGGPRPCPRCEFHAVYPGDPVSPIYPPGPINPPGPVRPGDPVFPGDPIDVIPCPCPCGRTPGNLRPCPRCEFIVGFSQSVFSPNPVSDILNIDLTQIETDAFGIQPFSETETIFDIRLLNSHGMTVRQQRTQAATIQFDVSNLPEGTYYLHIEHNGEIEMHQIIVQRN